jgi:pentatricopeptide repeat protein
VLSAYKRVRGLQTNFSLGGLSADFLYYSFYLKTARLLIAWSVCPVVVSHVCCTKQETADHPSPLEHNCFFGGGGAAKMLALWQRSMVSERHAHERILVAKHVSIFFFDRRAMERRALHLVCLQAKAGLVDEAFATLEEAKSRGLEPDIFCYGILVSGCARARQPFRAEQLVAKTIPAAGLVSNVIIWNALLGAFAQAGDKDGTYR